MGSADDLLVEKPTRVRFGVIGFLCALAFILYIDRVCIGQSASAMKEELGLSNLQFAFINAAFLVAYGLFEVVTGHWGDRYGSRRVLIRIVLWWSAFTALTGSVSQFSLGFGAAGANGQPGFVIFDSFLLMLLIRFLFGAGEAGALPNAARVISQWFPPGRRGPGQALVSMSAQVGGAVAPPVAAMLILALGWRWAFVVFGCLGVVWVAFFASWFRDEPGDHPGVNDAERRYIHGDAEAAAPVHKGASHPAIPWAQVLRSPNVYLLGLANACSSFYSYMLFFWFPTYLKEGRGAGEMASGWLASLPLLFGGAGVMLGGFVGDWFSNTPAQRRRTLRIMGVGGLAAGSVLVVASIQVESPLAATILCALAFFGLDVALAGWWATMAHVSGRHLGALFGLCNAVGIIGATISQFVHGGFADYMKARGYDGRAQWDPAFYLDAGVLLCGGLCWLFINSSRPIVED